MNASGQSIGAGGAALNGTSALYLPPQPMTYRPFKSLYSLLFVAAAAVHVLAAVALTNMSGNRPTLPTAQPIQWVSIAAPASEAPQPTLPKPKLVEPDVLQPIAPLIEIRSETAITLASTAPSAIAAHSAATNGEMVRTVSVVEYIREPIAKYPPTARALKQKGVVTVRALIDVDGRAREVHVYKSCGYKLLDDAARSAVLTAQFKPYMENGRSLPVYVLIPIEFGAS
jgi:periplasmic protein TonB